MTTLQILGSYAEFSSIESRLRGVGRVFPNSCADLGLAQLGDHIANNTHLERLEVHDHNAFLVSARDRASFVSGITHNSSIRDLRLLGSNISARSTRGEPLGSIACSILEAFCKKGNLTKISLQDCRLENGGVNTLASTLQKCKDIRYISLTESGLNDAHLAKLASACRVLDQLKVLELRRNIISRYGCESLAALLRQDSSCSLTTICLGTNVIDDSCAILLANSLAKNKTLKKLYLDYNTRITRCGWDALSRVLCNTSTINATYYSNHTLTSLGEYFADGTLNLPNKLSSLLALNKGSSIKIIAMKKILLHHPHFDIEPFFEFDLKLLPFLVGWFDRAKEDTDDIKSVETRKLDAIYQHIRAMPMMIVKKPPKNMPSSSFSLSVIMVIVSFFLYMAREVVNAR